jgi:hypothetical protein
VLDRAGAERLVRCAAAAAAIDEALGASVVRVAGAGRVVAENGPAPMVFRYVWEPYDPAQWPKVLISPQALPWPDDAVHVYATFRHAEDPLLARLLAQPWSRGQEVDSDRRVTVRLDAGALAALVTVTGEWAPTLPLPGPGPLAPTLVKSGAAGTTVVLFHSTWPDCVQQVNEWLAEQGCERGLVSVEDPSLPPDWYVTTSKGFVAEAAVGVFSTLDVDGLVAYLRRQPWTEDSFYAQLCFKRPTDSAFQLRQIWPLPPGRATVADVGPAPDFDAAFGHVIDPVLVVRGARPETALPPIEALRDWLETRGLAHALAPHDVSDSEALGLESYGEPRQGFVLRGEYGHGFSQEQATLLDAQPWSRSLRVLWVTQTACGFRQQRWIWDDPIEQDERPEWLLEQLRDRAWFHLRQAPAEDELARLDELLVRYMRTRGYTMLAEPRA